MTDITMYTSANNGEEILVFPFPPKELPDIVNEFKHEEFETNKKVLTLIGRNGRRSMSMELLLPVYKSYNGINRESRKNGRDYIDFWEKWSSKRVPMRLVITEGAKELINIAYTINALKWHYDKKKDIIAHLDISEYIFTADLAPTQSKPSYEWTTIYAEYKGVSYPMQAANVDGHYLVQLRKLLKLLGYAVSWDASTKSVIYTRSGEERIIKSQFEIYNGISYAYAYMVCRELGLVTRWDSVTRSIVIEEG